MPSASLWRPGSANDARPGQLVLSGDVLAICAGTADSFGHAITRFIKLTGDGLGDAVQLGNDRVAIFRGRLRFDVSLEQIKLATRVDAYRAHRVGVAGGLVLGREDAFVLGQANYGAGGGHSAVSASGLVLPEDEGEAFRNCFFAPKWSLTLVDDSVPGAMKEETILHVVAPCPAGPPFQGMW